MYVLAFAISIFYIEIFDYILPVLAATCCYLSHDNVTRRPHAISENSQIYSGGMALSVIWHDHGVLVITRPNVFYFVVFR